ncbi:ParB/RepB/Spo0J family partition protein [Xinfangfangia sp. CPCC 101601]|uniref:ParB/RepB/Spo0J family partition protein n=1 Tax=Pseudogemmobacter lacusdianii TaxID=3069608 RepID=A0ABU0VTW7_9RHOB|nr:ParB/RepB/Spo0J family partition protein [Xinfangfangia sp. CPCC 101601]MDQ2065176.1 ParB/RepB/Spo0J family partition protein [Xinfangfangia sp. CPCC 101601]
MEKKPERKGLGRGLSALMSDVNLGPATEAAPRRPDTRLAVEKLRANPLQPRKDFEPEALKALADSIRQKGVIQPLIVRPVGDYYEIVAGERRWRAAQMAQAHDVPVVIRELDDTEVLEIAIIENIQREDLNAIEEALGLRQLMDRFGHTQEKIAEALSKSRSHIANLLRLLTLPTEVQSFVREGNISAGHARALIGTPDPEAMARKIVAQGLSVRETERLVRESGGGKPGKASSGRGAAKDSDTRALEADLSAHLGMEVQIDIAGGQAGALMVRFKSLDDLDRLCQALSTVPAEMG